MPAEAYEVRLRPAARRQLERLERAVQLRLIDAMTGLAEEPRPAGVKALQGLPGLLRLRVGSYRVLYQVHNDRLLVLVVTLGHRRDVYRQR
ncbi:MAG: type II toxin-antitoxin system RelE/ParE family toxin [Candidatus Dormibacteraeota bacterium]|nr:type II toxin-antitoxin system RelE/ParE family toxin [Candidatus Dormibacteraeota bacterium]